MSSGLPPARGASMPTSSAAARSRSSAAKGERNRGSKLWRCAARTSRSASAAARSCVLAAPAACGVWKGRAWGCDACVRPPNAPETYKNRRRRWRSCIRFTRRTCSIATASSICASQMLSNKPSLPCRVEGVGEGWWLAQPTGWVIGLAFNIQAGRPNSPPP